MDLKELFELQATLNERVGLDGDKFACDFADGEGGHDNLMEAGRWIDDMLKAMASEMEELRDCTFWKHWCSEAQEGERYKIHNISGARKEVIDMLHFWVSLAQVLGMTPEMVENMYRAKLKKNIKRQDDGYSVKVKERAWALFECYPYDHPSVDANAIRLAKSLEDLTDEVQRYYINWAQEVLKSE